MINTVIEPEVAAWFESRGIEDQVLDYAGISSKRYSDTQLWVSFPRYNSEGDVYKSRMGTLNAQARMVPAPKSNASFSSPTKLNFPGAQMICSYAWKSALPPAMTSIFADWRFRMSQTARAA